jgi:hypothetical protein
VHRRDDVIDAAFLSGIPHCPHERYRIIRHIDMMTTPNHRSVSVTSPKFATVRELLVKASAVAHTAPMQCNGPDCIKRGVIVVAVAHDKTAKQDVPVCETCVGPYVERRDGGDDVTIFWLATG